jgi:biotin operon repressor
MSCKDRIIERLTLGADSSANLARILDCPEASIRRDIQALRRDGWNISFAKPGTDLYRLGA